MSTDKRLCNETNIKSFENFLSEVLSSSLKRKTSGLQKKYEKSFNNKDLTSDNIEIYNSLVNPNEIKDNLPHLKTDLLKSFTIPLKQLEDNDNLSCFSQIEFSYVCLNINEKVLLFSKENEMFDNNSIQGQFYKSDSIFNIYSDALFAKDNLAINLNTICSNYNQIVSINNSKYNCSNAYMHNSFAKKSLDDELFKKKMCFCSIKYFKNYEILPAKLLKYDKDYTSSKIYNCDYRERSYPL